MYSDKRAMVRESILNIVVFALLTFPSNEFDLVWFANLTESLPTSDP